MLILALDTTTRAGSVAVLRGEDVLAEIVGDISSTHGQRLPRDLQRALEAGGVRLEDLDLLAVSAGPGSFTGLRVGIASMQGLAFARGLKVVPVSALDALASEATRARPERDSLVAAWMDAQRGEVFAALYDATGEQALAGPSSGQPAATLGAWREIVAGQRVIMIGDGAVRYREVIEATLGNQARIVEPVPPLAAAIGRIALRHPDRAVLPHAIVPIYVRRPDAELARDRETNPTRE